MPRPLDITTTVAKDGTIPKTHRKRIAEHIRLFTGSPVRLQVSAPRRSTKANSFYWAGVIQHVQIACADAGRAVSGTALHEYFKQKYLPVQTETVGGVDVVIPFSTKKLNSTEFSDFIESIKTDELVLELGVYFEQPNDLTSFNIDELPY